MKKTVKSLIKFVFIYFITILSFVESPVFAKETGLFRKFQEAIKENLELRTRVEQLETTVVELQKRMLQMCASNSSSPQHIQSQNLKPTDPKKDDKPSLRSKNQIDVYGYIKFDAAYDNSRTDIGNYARWVYSESRNSDDAQLSLTTHQSRFGFNFNGPHQENLKTTGNLELELYGVGGAENKPTVGMRHAYFQLDWPQTNCQLLLGQTWDLIYPQIPNTLNYTVAWWVGNLGIRHPQIRFTKNFLAAKNHTLTLAMAAVRPIGDIGPFSLVDSGFDSASPVFQTRFSYSIPSCVSTKKAVIGISAHSGKDEYDYNLTGDSKKPKTSSWGIDWNIPLTPKFSLKGEFWKGKNLDQFAGGIGQGTVVKTASGTQILRYVNATRFDGTFIDIESIKSEGGWLELNLGPFPNKWSFNLGASKDDPDDAVLPTGARTKNTVRWVNALYDLNDSFQCGFELSKWQTNYQNATEGKNNRLQASAIYKF